MKSRFLTGFAAITLFAALAMPLRLGAQEQENEKPPHYSLMGTLMPWYHGRGAQPDSTLNDHSTELQDRLINADPFGVDRVGCLGFATGSRPDGASASTPHCRVNSKGVLTGYCFEGLRICGLGHICCPQPYEPAYCPPGRKAKTRGWVRCLSMFFWTIDASRSCR